MKRVLSLVLTIAIVLTSIVNAVVVLANSNPVTTTRIDLTQDPANSFATTGSTTSTTATVVNGKLKVSISAYERHLTSQTYGTQTWFPNYVLSLGGTDRLKLTNGNKAIVEVKYKVVSAISNDAWGPEIGIGNFNGGKGSNIYVRTYKKHTVADAGKEFTLVSTFTVDGNYATKIAFSGGGEIEISSIVVHELSASSINDYAVVKYVDGDNETTEFVKKNGTLKTPENATDFKGWFTSKEFSGEAVTTVATDVTLYAKYKESEPVSPITTTEIDLTQDISNTFATTGNTTSTTATVVGGKLKVNISAYERQLSAETSFSKQTWYPNYLLRTNNATLSLTNGNKVIVEVKYKVIATPNPNHGTQIGIGNFNGGKGSNIYVRTSKKHTAGDEGKEFTLTSTFIADNKHATKIAFSGGGEIEISSIVVHELPAANINDYAVVKYVDGDNETTEFVKKNGTLKTPENATDFKGWFTSKEFSGEAVTTVATDVTLYAKYKESEPVSPITTTVIDLNKEFEQYSFMTTDKTSNTTATIEDGKLNVNVSAYERQLSGITSYDTKTWFPRYLLYKNADMFTLKAGYKVIVEVKYKIIGSINPTHGLQIGLGFNTAGANTEMYVRTSKKHTALDKGKEFTLSSTFIADSNSRIKVAFSGGGQLEITSIVVHELPSENIDNYAVVKYVDGKDETTEFAGKNSEVKTPSDTSDFEGWFANADFTGNKVTTITEDVTLYAKRSNYVPESPIVTTVVDLNKEFEQYSFETTSKTSNTKATVGNGKLTVDISAYERQLSGITSYDTKTWFPRYLPYSDGDILRLTEGSRAIIEVKYKVTGTPNVTHGVQMGIASGAQGSGTEMYIRTSKKHTAEDKGKEFILTSDFIVDKKPAVKIAFSGGGQLEITSIVIHELPAQYVNDYVAVKFVDGKEQNTKFVKKNTAIEKPVNEFLQFGGWFKDKAFSGEAVNTVDADTTLYAKWDVEAGYSVINFYNLVKNTTKKYTAGAKIDFVPEKEGYNFLGWYKYDNYLGRAVTIAPEGLLDLYAKWEEKDPVLETDIDLTKNNKFVTTSKSSDSKMTVDGKKLVFEINNYERKLNSTDTSNADSWFPGYNFMDSNGNLVELEIGSAYELEVNYKIVDVKAGDNVGLQIGFGADGQVNQTRTRIKGYAMHTAADNGKEFTYATSYTAEKFNVGTQHLPKLLFSGQGTLEVISIKITKILPVIKDTVIGVQTYEDYDVGVETGVLGNKKGTEISKDINHTSGLFKNKSLKLDLNTEYLRLTGNTVISLMKEGELKPYVAEKGGAYRITFYMYANQDMNNLHWSINSVDETKKNDYFSYFKMEKDGEISLAKGKWTEVVAYIPALKGGESSKNLIAIAVASSSYDGKSVYIDDVKIEQLVDSEVVFYNTLCEEEISPQRAFRGEMMLSFKEPKREGYLFDGWYYDAEYKTQANTYDKFPSNKDEIELFAKWIEAPTTGYNFNAGSFDVDSYNNGVTPYENAIVDMDAPFDGKNNKGMTQGAVWVKDSGIYGNGTAETDGALAFSNAFYSNYTDKSSYNVVRLVNKDGTPYTVVKGERYTINFDYVFASSKGLSYIVPIISENSAYTPMGKNTTQTIGKVSVMETDTDYLTYKQSFIAEKTGYVYLALTGRDDNANVDTHCYEKVYVDNLGIKLEPNVVKLEIKKGKEVWYTKYGVKGEKLILSNAIKQGTDTFDGFYLDAEFTKEFDGYYPAEDTTIYIKVKTDKYDKPSDFTNPIVIDFEETKLLEKFYRQQKYMTSWSRETENEWIFVTDDEKNAFNGKNYIKLNGFGHYWNQAKFALYDPNHSENVMLLDKGGKYRVTVMVRCEDVYETPVNMTICLENPSQQHLLAENGNVKLEYTPAGDKDGYFMFVGDIEVAEEMAYYPSLAIRRNANDLQSIFIDTVKVEKLRECTVKFEENGGSEVDDVTVQIHDLAFDPGIPYKEGFVFDGWFVDNEFSRQWDFDKDTVEDDMTLYAKWSVEVIEETPDEGDSEEDSNKNVEEPDTDDDSNDYSSDYEETIVDNGLAPTLLDADKVIIEEEDNNTDETKDGLAVWVIILIIVGSVLVLCGATFVVIILIRKKRKI